MEKEFFWLNISTESFVLLHAGVRVNPVFVFLPSYIIMQSLVTFGQMDRIIYRGSELPLFRVPLLGRMLKVFKLSYSRLTMKFG